MADRIAGLAFLFPGQGSQITGMGKELAFNHAVARHTFEEADEALGYSLSKLCFEGPDDQLRLTEITQPAILTVSVAATRVLAEAGILPSFVAGHSLGEYSAHVAAGTISFADAVRTVRNRGKYMQEAVPVGIGAMAAILALGLVQIRSACSEALFEFPGQICEPANINSPGQVVISGSKAAVERAAELCKGAGAKRAIMLPVSAPFHCSLMQPAQDRLAADLHALTFNNPEVPVLCNVEAAFVTDAAKSRDTLIRQVTGAVQWETSMQVLVAQGATRFLEAGPGSVLTGLLRQIDKSQSCVNVENEATLQKAKALFAK
ncbi:MAG: [acyl-carrier-protein] S-malonyltransferase [Acidobacteria bacterium]|nr:MAG: [acyl-carrier-protein] S-malonyltransferase [Acidobacteriota bacterium]